MQKEGMNKRGQDLSIGTLILIVLGIVVLVLLIMGFSLGWSNLWDKINVFGGGSSLSTIAAACDFAAKQDNNIRYCQEFQSIKIDGETHYYNCENPKLQDAIESPLTCTQSTVNTAKKAVCDGIADNKREKSLVFAKNAAGEKCDIISPIVEAKQTCTDLTGVWQPAECDTLSQTELTPTDTSDKEPTDVACCKAN